MSTAPVIHKNVHAAKLAVMKEVGYCRKQRAQGLNYTFAGEAALIEALRPEMIEAGLVISPIHAEMIDNGSYTTSKGSVLRLVKTKHVFRLTHADSDTHEDIEVLGEASDSGDKTLPKCQTIAFKYALRQAFVIETGDDPDKYKSEEEAPPVKQQTKPPATTAPPTNGIGPYSKEYIAFDRTCREEFCAGKDQAAAKKTMDKIREIVLGSKLAVDGNLTTWEAVCHSQWADFFEAQLCILRDRAAQRQREPATV